MMQFSLSRRLFYALGCGAVIFSGLVGAHVGDTYRCAAVISASCGEDSLCLGLFDDEKGVLPMQFDRRALDVRAGHTVHVHGSKHDILSVRIIAPGFRYLVMAPHEDSGEKNNVISPENR